MRNIILLLCCFALCPVLLAAQEQDPHFQFSSVAAVAHRSTFLHGYLHGYEEGFHQGDFDLQMGRVQRGEYNADASLRGYRKDFGPKQMYKAGFHEGFAVGFADAAAGRRFRAIENVEAAFSAPPAQDKVQSAAFDQGVDLGYLAGQRQGLADARRQLRSQASSACPAGPSTNDAGFCSAYAQGFQLGYVDGFTNQARTTLAQK
ncbi:MAG: hypothetical protein ACRD3E_00305 [Terriglobales bacterium]